ncbi:Agamous-like MADS-box protein AGL80 [Linum perenne]
MTRKKVKLAYITNDSARKATYKKRKKGLIKKVSELSTLCDIQACAIIYSPYDTQPEIWPPTTGGVHQVLSRFKKVPQMEQSKKMVNQEKFLGERIKKAMEQLRKQKRENEEKMVTNAVYECLSERIPLHELTLGDLDTISRAVDQQIKDIDRRVAEIGRRGDGKGVQGGGGSSSGVNVELDSGEVRPQMMMGPKEEYVENNMESFQRQQWFMEMMNPAAVPTQTPMLANEQHIEAATGGFMGEDMTMMMTGGFGETSTSANWVGNGNNNNISTNSFWPTNNPFFP